MEDARKEFQVFLSPTRTGMENINTSNVQRVIPVVNKFFSSSNSPFNLTQRRGSVYKAVSGISFQESDEKKRSNKKDKSNFKRERSERRSIVMGYDKISKKNSETRRSKSLTSIGAQIASENEYNVNNVPEYVHPFSPTAIQNRLGRHDKSVRARKRASSQSRQRAELSIYDVNTDSKTDHPKPPRRARSVSRCRKYDTKTSDEISLKQNRSNSLDSTADLGLLMYTDANINSNNCIKPDGCKKTIQTETTVDFDVNETDWKAYDKIISEKLNTLLRSKEEPEGGYFSLERDDCEEQNGSFVGEDNSFQQDYYNESIYISQTLDQVSEVEPPLDTFVYPSPNGNTRECHDPDDEGLYEEIYFDSSDHQIPVEVKRKISHGDRAKDVNRSRKPPRIEQGPNGTVVYITSSSSPASSHKSNVSSSSDSNQLSMMDEFLKSKRNIFIEQMNSNYFLSKDSARNGQNIRNEKNNNGTKDSTTNSQICCTSKFMTKVTLPVGNDSTHFIDKAHGETKLYNLSIAENGYSRKVESTPVNNAPKKIKSADMKKSKSSGSFEKDFELSDLDLDMFAPKHFNPRKKRHTRAGDSTEYEKSLLKLQQLQFKSVSQFENNLPISRPPNSFQAFLHNSVFNPPEPEFIPDEPLVIKEDQIITCITDSSSDDTDGDSDDSSASPWLEASKDFEYVGFQDKSPHKSARGRKKGMAHLTNMLNLPFPNNSYQDEGKKQSNVRYIPQRPSRSKHRNRSKK